MGHVSSMRWRDRLFASAFLWRHTYVQSENAWSSDSSRS